MKRTKVNELLKDEYDLREGVPDSRYNGKYTLYKRYDLYNDGTMMQLQGTHGMTIETFKTVTDAFKYATDEKLLK